MPSGLLPIVSGMLASTPGPVDGRRRAAPIATAATALLMSLVVTATTAFLTATLLAAIVFVPASPAAGADPSQQPGSSAALSGPTESANARFAVAGYQAALGRLPDTTGLDFHLGRLAAGGDRSRETFAYALLFSEEGSRLEVDRAYADLLDRSPDPAGRDYWTDHLAGHGVLDLRVLLLSSDEFHRRSGGTDTAWIRALYQSILGRQPEPAGLDYWLPLAEAGTPRALIAAGVYISDEALGRRADAYYQETVGRAPTAAERSRSITAIRSVGERGLRARLIASDEAFEPFLLAALS